MARRESKKKGTVEPSPGTEKEITAEGVDLWKEEEMLPEGAQPTREPPQEGNVPDTAGKHGPMAPEAARGLEEEHEEESDEP